MNVKQTEVAASWLKQKNNGTILLVTGPTSSGKSTLVEQLFTNNGLRVRELSGFDTDFKTELYYISKECTSKTVAEYAGLICTTKPQALVVEDVEFCAPADFNAIIAFSKLKIIPVVCVAKQMSKEIPGACHVRLFMPSASVVAAILMQMSPSLALQKALELARKTNCDIRQAKLSLQLGLDKPHDIDRQPSNVYDALSFILPYKSYSAFNISDDPMLTLMVAENYLKVKDPGIDKIASAAHDISTSDTICVASSEASNIFSLLSVPFILRSKPLLSRATYPSVVSHKATEATNRRKLPWKILDYRTINAIEKRIVDTLCKGVPVKAVALEMASMDLSSIEQWEAVRVLAAIGREAHKVTTTIKEELRRHLRVNADHCS